ncbi:MAG: DUF4236 domain-containing protein [Clostridiales bacterium]|nr:DUF4236 domain-containing protein [Clostridiales bacterium]
MGFKMRKSIKLAPGVRLNVGKKSAGISFGTGGLRYSINSSGRRTTTVGIPGTGISYSTSTSNKKYKTKAYNDYANAKRRLSEVEKHDKLNQAKLIVEEFEKRIEYIKSLHKECDDPIDWEYISKSSPPFNKEDIGPKEREAISIYNSYKPNLLEKIFKSLLVKKQSEFQNNIEQSRKEDLIDYENWEHLYNLSHKILNGDIDSMLSVIDEMKPLNDLLEFGSGFDISIENPNLVEVEFQVMSNNVIPNEQKTLTPTGKLSIKPMPKTKKLDLIQDYVCSCVLRIARDIFALLPIQYVLIHANDIILNSKTGFEENITLLSVLIDKAILNSLNMDMIDPSDSMSNFKCNMSFTKNGGFKPVEKLSNKI